MQKNSKKKNSVTGKYQLLYIVEDLDKIIANSENIPKNVVDSLINARDVAWMESIKEWEKSMPKRDNNLPLTQ